MKRVLVAVLILSIILASGCLNAPAELKKERIINAIENTESATLHLDENLTINAIVPEKNLTVTYNT
ncbi:MAG: hypothetical protein H0Z18_08965 [Thermococcus sp.]|uniref:hypothetical protein n=1 Tax=Thermococcus sp. TaxID=35749 RepID=UPI001DC57AD3|nr:hypothetical protein [Thermococcus sp.]MBO8175373.1 hypothetical protein [Thermococcus sp.]